MGEACRALGTPVTGGNVSFYNESEDTAILPTPVIGMIGLMENVDQAVRSYFQKEGDVIILLGQTKAELGGSEYLMHHYGVLAGDAPELNLELEKRTQFVLRKGILSGWVRSAHDCAEGGLGIALAECCILNREQPKGAQIHLENGELTTADLLFSESASRILLSCLPETAAEMLDLADFMNVPAAKIGEVGGDRLQINSWVDQPLDRLIQTYYQALPDNFSGVTVAR
jgi:phosphoribosylformylglycinamidine synthase subunit PurL